MKEEGSLVSRKTSENKGLTREEIMGTLKDKFGEKNPESGFVPGMKKGQYVLLSMSRNTKK